MADVKGLTGLNGPGAGALVQRLTAQVFIEPAQEGGHLFTLAQHLRDCIPDISPAGAPNAGAAEGVAATVQVTEQVERKSKK